MGTAFYDDAHKRQKLNGTICLYRGEPYHVDARDNLGEHMVRLVPIDGRRMGRGGPEDQLVDYRSHDFNYKAPPLGYTTYQGEAYYVARLPDRVNTQGLAHHTLVSLSGSNIPDSYSWFMSTAAKECILGLHKSYKEAVEAVFDDHSSCSFDRHFAVARLGRKSLSLLSRGRIIGSTNSPNAPFTLCDSKDMKHLKKVLETKGVITC